MKKAYNNIVLHYENCLDKHGDTHLGVDWPIFEDVAKRYKVMLEVTKDNFLANKKNSLLDLGCGTAHLYEYILNKDIKNIEYSGLDISQKFVDFAELKFPNNNFYCMDVLDSDNLLPNFDFIIMNGVFTEKRELSFQEMWEYFTDMINIVFEKSNIGVAFNLMSKNVDWERDDLFHVSLDMLSDFICKNLTRNFIIRNDYGLYEYTVYIYK